MCSLCTLLCLSEWGNDRQMFYIIPRNILYAAKIFSSAHNYFDHILGGPLTIIWVHGNLVGCTDIYLPALNIFMLACIFYVDPQTFWCSRRKLFIAQKIFSNPENLLHFLCRFFGSSLFWIAGLP